MVKIFTLQMKMWIRKKAKSDLYFLISRGLYSVITSSTKDYCYRQFSSLLLCDQYLKPFSG